MNLADRITRLEAMLRPTATLPVVLEECDLFAHSGGHRTILRSRDGARWDQRPDETPDAFRTRVKAEARQGVRAAEGDTVIRLVMLRPQIGRDEWLATHGAGNTAA